jgi:hypothetical protein
VIKNRDVSWIAPSGHLRRPDCVTIASGLTREADIFGSGRHFAFVPIPDIGPPPKGGGSQFCIVSDERLAAMLVQKTGSQLIPMRAPPELRSQKIFGRAAADGKDHALHSPRSRAVSGIASRRNTRAIPATAPEVRNAIP